MIVKNEQRFIGWLKSVLKYDEGLDEATFNARWLEALQRQYNQTDLDWFVVSEHFTKSGKPEAITFQVKHGLLIF